MLYTVLYALLLIWLSWEDIKHLRISISILTILGVITISEGLQYPFSNLGASLLGSICIFTGLKTLNYAFQNFTKMEGIGSGDVWLLSILAFGLPLEQLPTFIFLSGFFACIWGYWQWKRVERFPMVPAISASFLVIRLFC